ncbi:hypothetical protein [Brevibacillus sp. H7]|uniref:hypothetical protein n=1 Tax=Brevibacillus sp. H7 TaxID=3349138 RepID=UPI0037F799FE
MTIFYGISAIIVIASLFFSVKYIKKQEKKEFDTKVSQTTVKHQVIGNPAVIVYIIGFAIWLTVAILTLFYL